MKTTILLLGAGAIAFSPSAIVAHPGQGGGVGHGATMSQGHMMGAPITPSGSTKGVGWDHLNGPTSTGQPSVECGDVRPGRAASAPGSAFNEDGKAGTQYAGEKPQNSRNSASISQYDVACLHQPQR
jgi:hypothetical protein